MPGREIAAVLKTIEVEEVWGVGGRSMQNLAGQGIRTTYDLSCANDRWVRKKLRIIGVRRMPELPGNSCYPQEEMVLPRQARGKIFTPRRLPVLPLQPKSSCAVTAGCLTLSLTRNRFRNDLAPYSNRKTVSRYSPTAEVAGLIAQAGALSQRFVPGGVGLSEGGGLTWCQRISTKPTFSSGLEKTEATFLRPLTSAIFLAGGGLSPGGVGEGKWVLKRRGRALCQTCRLMERCCGAGPVMPVVGEILLSLTPPALYCLAA